MTRTRATGTRLLPWLLFALFLLLTFAGASQWGSWTLQQIIHGERLGSVTLQDRLLSESLALSEALNESSAELMPVWSRVYETLTRAKKSGMHEASYQLFSQQKDAVLVLQQQIKQRQALREALAKQKADVRAASVQLQQIIATQSEASSQPHLLLHANRALNILSLAYQQEDMLALDPIKRALALEIRAIDDGVAGLEDSPLASWLRNWAPLWSGKTSIEANMRESLRLSRILGTSLKQLAEANQNLRKDALALLQNQQSAFFLKYRWPFWLTLVAASTLGLSVLILFGYLLHASRLSRPQASSLPPIRFIEPVVADELKTLCDTTPLVKVNKSEWEQQSWRKTLDIPMSAEITAGTDITWFDGGGLIQLVLEESILLYRLKDLPQLRSESPSPLPDMNAEWVKAMKNSLSEYAEQGTKAGLNAHMATMESLLFDLLAPKSQVKPLREQGINLMQVIRDSFTWLEKLPVSFDIELSEADGKACGDNKRLRQLILVSALVGMMYQGHLKLVVSKKRDVWSLSLILNELATAATWSLLGRYWNYLAQRLEAKVRQEDGRWQLALNLPTYSESPQEQVRLEDFLSFSCLQTHIGCPEMELTLLDHFLESLAERELALLQAALESAQWDTLIANSKRLAKRAEFYGVTQIQQQLSHLHKAAQEEDRKSATTWLNQLKNALVTTLEIVEQI